jgi:hypothetical protein
LRPLLAAVGFALLACAASAGPTARCRNAAPLPARAEPAYERRHAGPTDPPCKKVGEARLKVLLWSVYDSRLYTPSGNYNDGDRPAAPGNPVSARYRKQAREVAPARDRVGGDGAQPPEPASLAEGTRFDLWPDIRSNDVLALELDQDSVARLSAQRQALGTVDDPDFGQQFVDIWLSRDAPVQNAPCAAWTRQRRLTAVSRGGAAERAQALADSLALPLGRFGTAGLLLPRLLQIAQALVSRIPEQDPARLRQPGACSISRQRTTCSILERRRMKSSRRTTISRRAVSSISQRVYSACSISSSTLERPRGCGRAAETPPRRSAARSARSAAPRNRDRSSHPGPAGCACCMKRSRTEPWARRTSCASGSGISTPSGDLVDDLVADVQAVRELAAEDADLRAGAVAPRSRACATAAPSPSAPGTPLTASGRTPTRSAITSSGGSARAGRGAVDVVEHELPVLVVTPTSGSCHRVYRWCRCRFSDPWESGRTGGRRWRRNVSTRRLSVTRSTIR